MFDLFGAEMPLAVRFFLAFLIVLGLIGAAALAVRRFGSGRLGRAARSQRAPRRAARGADTPLLRRGPRLAPGRYSGRRRKCDPRIVGSRASRRRNRLWSQPQSIKASRKWRSVSKPHYASQKRWTRARPQR